MKRKITAELLHWKESYAEMPFMLTGARQVGKTHILNEFCKSNYKNSVYVNLEYEENIREVFEATLKPKEIINSIELLKGIRIDPLDTVIFFDEIQVSERAITSLKYFNEADEPYHILSAGSLLGVVLNRFSGSFPVGKVYRSKLFPLNFQEFLWGIGEERLEDAISEAFNAGKPLITPVHQKCLELYRDYLYVGGMPASVLEYIGKDRKISHFDGMVKRNILDHYLADMSKYTTSAEHQKIGKVYHSIPKQLGKEGRFSYKFVDEHGSKRKFESSIDWLINSHLVTQCTLVETPRTPLKVYEKESMFKLYMNDTGLLMTLSGMQPGELLGQEATLYRGMLTENYVAQTFTCNGLDFYFWKSKHNAEVDFLITLEGNAIPVEVKSAGNTKSKSLNVYRKLYNPAYAIKLSANNFNESNGVKSIPLYAAYLLT